MKGLFGDKMSLNAFVQVLSILFLMILILIILPFQVEGKDVGHLNVNLTVLEGEELLEVRGLVEEMGCTISFNDQEKVIYIRNEDKIVNLFLESGMIDGREMNKKAFVIDGRTYLVWEDIKKMLGELKGNKIQIPEILTGIYVNEKEISKEAKAYIRAYNLSDEKVSLDFSSGQKYDLYLYKSINSAQENDIEREEVWHWAEGKFFTMALERIDLEPGDSLAYDVDIEAELKSGEEYILTGELAVIGNPLKLNEIVISIFV